MVNTKSLPNMKEINNTRKIIIQTKLDKKTREYTKNEEDAAEITHSGKKIQQN